MDPAFTLKTGDGPPVVRMAEYVRMTDHECYSTENQAEATQANAALRGIEIVRV